MRKNLLSALVAASLVMAGGAQAALVFDFDGAGGNAAITVGEFDWWNSTYLALDGNKAVADFLNDFETNGIPLAPHTFTGYTHAKLNSAHLTPGYEITMVAMFQEIVTLVDTGLVSNTAYFQTTGVGWVELYYGVENSVDLTGYGFNDGKLIARLSGVEALDDGGAATGSFTTQLRQATAPYALLSDVPLDAAPNNKYGTQMTISGSSSQEDIAIGGGTVELDHDFFKTTTTGFTMTFGSLGMNLPITNVDPSDCFTLTQSNAVNVGDASTAATCANNHVDNSPYSLQADGANGTGSYVPEVGVTNGKVARVLGVWTATGDDLVAKTDTNSSVSGVFYDPSASPIPEPTTLALLGVGLMGLGFAAARRRAGA